MATFVMLSTRHQILAAGPREETDLSRHRINQIQGGAEPGCWWHKPGCMTDCLPDLVLLELLVLVQKSCFSGQANRYCQSVNWSVKLAKICTHWRCGLCLGDPLCCGEAFQYEGRCVLALIEGICPGGKCHDGCR